MNKFMRFASPNERRTISREDAGFYHAVVVGAVYEFENQSTKVPTVHFFSNAVRQVIQQHPWLCVVLRDTHTDKAYYESVPTLNLDNHIKVMSDETGPTSAPESAEEETTRIERFLAPIVDTRWPASVPAWTMYVLQLPSSADCSRCFVAFTFSHTLGDGMNGPIFHRALQHAFLQTSIDDTSMLVSVRDVKLPLPFDTPQRLSVSWSYLLAPLLAVVLPKFVAKTLGLRATGSTVNDSTWTGANMFLEQPLTSSLRLIHVKPETVRNLLRLGRRNNAKLTGTLHQFIMRGVLEALGEEQRHQLLPATAMNMRGAVGIPEDEMGLFVNACFQPNDTTPRAKGPLCSEEWSYAQVITKNLAINAKCLQDQPIGLLRYAPSIRKWTLGKLGQQRDCSYVLSNLGAFDPDTKPHVPPSRDGTKCKITSMVFSHSADAVGSPLIFNAVSVKDGCLYISIVWQNGALGVSVEDEIAFIDTVCARMKDDFDHLE